MNSALKSCCSFCEFTLPPTNMTKLLLKIKADVPVTGQSLHPEFSKVQQFPLLEFTGIVSYRLPLCVIADQ